MRLLKEMGVKLVVDDFGVGYSGLGYLRSLPISKLKIDRSFIKDVLSDADDRAITLAVIAIAHQLDLQVIAEGVETIAHFEFLKLHHVDAAQGNYLCKPLDADQCAAFLKSDSGKVTS
jgi:EAL domain-containing protein (putative c-di-GMP-specific phosphodiesterase class I)